MDGKGLRILKAAEALESGSPDRITEETSVPRSAVHYRLERLQKQGIIRNDIFGIDLEKARLNLMLTTEVWTEYGSGYHKEVGGKLGEMPGVSEVCFALGNTGFVLISHLASCSMAGNLISGFEEIDEISRASPTFVIMAIRDELSPLSDYELERLKAALPPDVS